jgi:hypothetical protein
MNIFYTEVDANLQKELNARGSSGFYDRSTNAIDFMVGKIANVKITAYDKNDSAGNVVGVLGGDQTRTGRFMPTGPDGYLTDSKITQQELTFYTETDVEKDPKAVVGNAYTRPHTFIDKTKRTGPYITNVDISIGDHSMGLLNKATVQFTIPNITRDLDVVEQIWFRPGRYISIDIEHPKSALVSTSGTTATTNGLLTPLSIPNREKLLKLYPSWKTEMDKFITQMSRMNAVRFEGLITQFDFQFTPDGTITATLSVTGTSNVYTDISMYLDSNKAKIDQGPKPFSPTDLVVTSSRKEFYEVLYDNCMNLQSNITKNSKDKQAQYIIPYTNETGLNPENTDRFILFGEPYKPTTATNLVQKNTTAESNYSIYITFGGLIHFVNNYILTKIEGSVSVPEIVFSDTACYSNYYERLVSADPENVLLLPASTNSTDCNTYGELVYYANVNSNIDTYSVNSLNMQKWPGVYSYAGNAGKYYPSRIFINLEKIQTVVNNLTAEGTKSFSVSSFISTICDLVKFNTGGAIELKLVSHPTLTTKLMLMDDKYINGKRVDDTKTVVPYSVPMFSNHPNGSVVQEFSFSAKLPESAKNLSYVLNSGDDVTELDVAPYMNFMYNAQNKDELNKLQQRYRDAHETVLENLAASRTKFGESPGIPELQTALRKSLAEYIKKPFNDFRTSAQMTAPIFPFEASITLNGIHGFKYGDVLQFEALPMRYRMNTVFSVISISHSVSTSGEWNTTLKCIMRPSID